jgi:hypothetical protein
VGKNWFINICCFHKMGQLVYRYHSAAHGVALVSGFTGEFAAYSQSRLAPAAAADDADRAPHDSAASLPQL